MQRPIKQLGVHGVRFAFLCDRLHAIVVGKKITEVGLILQR